MAAPAVSEQEAPGAAGLILGLCFLTAVCEGFDVQAAGVAAGGIAREFHVAPSALAYFFSAANLGLLIGALIGGRLSDRVGRKAVLIGSLAVFGLFSLATAFAGDIQGLTVVRLLTGVGLGGAMPTMIAVAAGVRGGMPKAATSPSPTSDCRSAGPLRACWWCSCPPSNGDRCSSSGA